MLFGGWNDESDEDGLFRGQESENGVLFGERAVHRGRSLVRFDFLIRFRNDTGFDRSNAPIRVVNNKRTQLTVAAILYNALACLSGRGISLGVKGIELDHRCWKKKLSIEIL